MDISAQKYKIWINTSWMIFMTPGQFKKMDFKSMSMICLLQEPTVSLIKQYLHKMMEGNVEIPVIITTENQASLWKKLLKKTPMVYAAGGIVQRPDDKYLFIYRRGWWDLPKGKLDGGETNRKAALREVKEEVGLDSKIKSSLPNTYHCYYDNDVLVIKETAWYRMRTEQTKPKLQFEEDITACKWVNTSGLSKMKSKVYPNLKMLVDSMV